VAVSVRVNDGSPVSAPITGSGFTAPLLARSVQVPLRAGANTITFFNDTAYAPDLDRLTISPLLVVRQAELGRTATRPPAGS
jgi:alpha-L-fucosidase